ncbi:MAG: hypothetical protein LC627_06085, partial [Verrucomicrobiaceae bacterium]|nr:hypothetical protein [Verrucomicrobiaceae bacterium]
VCVQETRDVERWESLGVDRGRIHHVGSIKFDPSDTTSSSDLPFEVLASFGLDAAHPVLFGGSTHSGEEEILARAFLQLRQELPQLSLIIAPRHVERVSEIRAALEQLGLRVAHRSAAMPTDRPPDCLLIDTTGELASWYAVATVVFMGKSLTAHGGQNPVEAILAGRPVIFGPHMENFAALAQSLIADGGAVQISAAGELEAAVRQLLHDADARERLVQNAQRVVAQHRGATERTAALLIHLESTSPCG